MNKAILIGYLGGTPDLSGNGNQARAVVGLATSMWWRDGKTGERRERTEWHNLVIWGARANAFAKYLQKGDHVMVEGRITYNETERDGAKVRYTNIVVEQWQRLNKRDDTDDQAEGEGEEQAA